MATAAQYSADLRNQHEKRSTTEPHQDNDDARYRGTNTRFPCYTDICVIPTFVKNQYVCSSSYRRQNKNQESQAGHTAGTLAEVQITVVPAECLPVLSNRNYSVPS